MNPLQLSQRPLLAALIAAMVLVQGFLLQHELEHALAGDDDSCLVCHLAGHQGDALVASALHISVAPSPPPREEAGYLFLSPSPRHYAARAPPYQTLL
jgi:hypothetical protein